MSGLVRIDVLIRPPPHMDKQSPFLNLLTAKEPQLRNFTTAHAMTGNGDNLKIVQHVLEFPFGSILYDMVHSFMKKTHISNWGAGNHMMLYLTLFH